MSQPRCTLLKKHFCTASLVSGLPANLKSWFMKHIFKYNSRRILTPYLTWYLTLNITQFLSYFWIAIPGWVICQSLILRVSFKTIANIQSFSSTPHVCSYLDRTLSKWKPTDDFSFSLHILQCLVLVVLLQLFFPFRLSNFVPFLK